MKLLALACILVGTFALGRIIEQIAQAEAELVFTTHYHRLISSGETKRLERAIAGEVKGLNRCVDDPVNAFLWNLSNRKAYPWQRDRIKRLDQSLKEAKSYASSLPHPAAP